MTSRARHLDHVGWWPWLIVIVVLLGTGASNREGDPRLPVVVGVLLALAAALPAVLRRGPVLSLLASGVATGAYFAAGYVDGPVFLALPAVAAVAALRDEPRTWLPPAGAGTALALAGLVVRTVTDADQFDRVGWQIVGLVAVVSAGGAVATVLRTRLEARDERTQRTATEERLRMARELHDGVGHGLAVIAMQAGVGLHLLGKDSDADLSRVRESLEAIRATSRESLDALRSELALMSGEPAARRPVPGIGDIPALVDRVRSGGLEVEVAGDAGVVDERVGGVVYGVVQEALTNVLRHASAGRAAVRLDRGDGVLVVSVTDDGRSAHGLRVAEGMGLSDMRSRVEAHDGALEVGATGEGFRVRAELPAAAP